jgi:hypothetical protein
MPGTSTWKRAAGSSFPLLSFCAKPTKQSIKAENYNFYWTQGRADVETPKIASGLETPVQIQVKNRCRYLGEVFGAYKSQIVQV